MSQPQKISFLTKKNIEKRKPKIDCGQTFCPSYPVLMEHQDMTECHDCDCAYCPFKAPSGKLDLVLKGFWYKQIENGTKKIEYRDNTDFWRKRILSDAAYKLFDGHKITEEQFLPIGFLKHSVVVLRNAYSKESLTFKILSVKMNKEQFHIYLGERIKDE